MKGKTGMFAKALEELAVSADPRPLLIECLGFNHAKQEAIDTARWPDEWTQPVIDARFVAEKSGFRVASVLVSDSTPSKTWRAIARQIVVDYDGLVLVAVHTSSGLRWLWSSSSLEQRRTVSSLAEGIRHITIELGPDGTAPAGFLDLLSEIDVSGAESDLDVLTKVSGAFDRYTISLQADIGKNAYEALRLLSEGLLGRKSNALSRDVQTLERIRSEVFILLYRFLFVLYAEAREVFPINHPIYREHYGLSWWRENVILPLERNREIAFKRLGGARGTTLWQRCRDLFHLIMTGSVLQGHKPDQFNFRAYYGTIFDVEMHPDLERWDIPNDCVADAMRALTRFRDEGGSTFFVDYSSLEIRHLGSIYERLLEYHMTIGDEGTVEHTVNELERKSTGSYFTPSGLIARLVGNTLDPILEGIRQGIEKEDREGFERGVYSLRICDPAMGSGHFLVGAMDHLARAILEHRRHVGGFSEDENQAVEIKRTIVRRCLYGVDRNELAVELAKMSLWLETANSERPLSFLDAHLKTGNSLVGAWFDSLADPQRSIFGADIRDHLKDEVRDLVAIERQEEMVAVDVQQKVRLYRKLRSSDTRYGRLEKLLDAQIAVSFGAPVDDWRTAREVLREPRAFDAIVSGPHWKRAAEAGRGVGFFHWELEFPEVFYTEQGEPKGDPGFDAIVGNPPWDRIRMIDEEFFRYRAPELATVQNASVMAKRLSTLKEANPSLWKEYESASQDISRLNDYFRTCGDYPLSTRGPLNYYPLFVERSMRIVRQSGYVGMIVPTGLLTDFNNQDLLHDLLSLGLLVDAADFENKGMFPDVDDRFRFSLTVISRKGGRVKTRYVFRLHGLSEIDNPERWFELSAKDIQIFNPNTGTVPLFYTKRDATLNKKIYDAAGAVLLDESKGQLGNPWKIRTFQMVNIASDSHLFGTRSELERTGWSLRGNVFTKGSDVMIPLVEAKMIHLWNPRYATFHGADSEAIRKGKCRNSESEELSKPNWEPLPRYWFPQKTAQDLWRSMNWGHSWTLAFRDIVRATDERTTIGCFAPAYAFSHHAPVLTTSTSAQESTLLLANLSSFVLDYCARSKVGGTHLSFFILNQLPVLPPQAYAGWTLDGRPLAFELASMALFLSCPSRSLQSLAGAAEYAGSDSRWDEPKRFDCMRRIDAIYAHLYGLSREDFAYILDTFPIVRDNDIRRFGEYRTKIEALRTFDELTERLVRIN